MRDIPGERVVKENQVRDPYGNSILTSHIYCSSRPGWHRIENRATYLVNGLSSSAKSGIFTIIKYKFHIIVVIIGKAGKGLKMRDIPVEWFVKLSQVRCSYGIEI